MTNVFEINGAGAPVDLVIPQGIDFGWAILVEQRDPDTLVWANKDITGYTGTADIKDTSGAVVASFAVVVSADLSVVALNLAGADSTSMTWTNGTYSCVIEAPSGERYELAYGRVALVAR